MFEYVQRRVGGGLGRVVESVWFARGRIAGVRERIAPTGSTVAAVVLGDPIRQTAEGHGAALEADTGFLIGPHDRPLVNEPLGETYCVGIVTTPVGCRPVFGLAVGTSSVRRGNSGEIDLAEPSRPFLDGMRGEERIVVHSGTWPKADLRALYGEMHCLLAPSRGEGKNLAALEFLATGAPVVATATGGHRMWLDESYAYPLRFRMRPATWPRPTTAAEEADADAEHLKELMWRVYTDLGEAERMGRRAADVVPATHSWQAVLPRLRRGLAEVGVPITV